MLTIYDHRHDLVVALCAHDFEAATAVVDASRAAGLDVVNHTDYSTAPAFVPLLQEFSEDMRLPAFRFLLRSGAKTSVAEGLEFGSSGWRNMEAYLAASGKLEALRAVFEVKGCEGAAQLDDDGWAPIHYAALDCKLNTSVLLLDVLPTCGRWITHDGKTPLSIAASRIPLWKDRAALYCDGLRAMLGAIEARAALLEMSDELHDTEPAAGAINALQPGQSRKL